MPPDVLTRPDGPDLAYVRTRGRGPGVVFLGGFMSDMTGSKAAALEDFCRRRGQAFLRFDYRGHGRSGGTFTDGTIGRWREDALLALDQLTDGPQILVGSSMGGWIMSLLALARPARLCGLVGIAPAPDFTEDLMWEIFDDRTRATLRDAGVVYQNSAYGEAPYPITRTLIEDGRAHLVLRAPIPFQGPVRLVHGMEDKEVPWQVSVALMERLQSRDARLELIKDGEHRLSRPEDIARIAQAIAEISGF